MDLLLAVWRILQVVLGIGLVIFVHESGHFIAARLCKVRVHVFSLGFGPRLFGWRRGHTDYQIAAVPLGGYVRMAGEESHYSGQPAEDFELAAKSIGQRFFIYSAGVLMNVAFGLVVFPILFTAGIPSLEPIVGEVEEGSPAWLAGLEPGSRILEVNDESIYDLGQLPIEVAYSGTGPVKVLSLPPGASDPVELFIQPTVDEYNDIYSIGQISPAWRAGHPLVVAADGPAAKAGVRNGDSLLRVLDSPPGLTPDEQLQRALESQRAFTVQVERDGSALDFLVEPKDGPPAKQAILGVASPHRLLIAIRDSPLTRTLNLRVDDRLLAVEGKSLLRKGDLVDALAHTEGLVEWTVRRGDKLLTWESAELSAEMGVQLSRELALGPDEESTQIVVSPGSAAEAAGLQSLDEIIEIEGVAVRAYADIVSASRKAAVRLTPVHFAVLRDVEGQADAQRLELTATPARWIPKTSGLSLQYATYTYKVKGVGDALRLGATSSFKMLHDVWRHLRGMMRQEVGKQNAGSIIQISIVAHETAQMGWVKFFWFLCLLSMNLAFINLLPIPILDGGQLFFLIIEKIKGSPVSERIFSYSQLVGLVLIVSIFVFVIYNDLSRHVFN